MLYHRNDVNSKLLVLGQFLQDVEIVGGVSDGGTQRINITLFPKDRKLSFGVSTVYNMEEEADNN